VLLVLLGSWNLLMTETLTVQHCLGALLLLLLLLLLLGMWVCLMGLQLGEMWVCQMLPGWWYWSEQTGPGKGSCCCCCCSYCLFCGCLQMITPESHSRCQQTGASLTWPHKET
jgi:hypothetical protein